MSDDAHSTNFGVMDDPYKRAASAPVGEAQDAPTLDADIQAAVTQFYGYGVPGHDFAEMLAAFLADQGGGWRLVRPTPTSDGLRDDLARAICGGHAHNLNGWCVGAGRSADAVLPVVEAAVTTATEAARAERDAVARLYDGVCRLAYARGEERDAARGEVAAARTALDQIAALCDQANAPLVFGAARLPAIVHVERIRALLPTQGETK